MSQGYPNKGLWTILGRSMREKKKHNGFPASTNWQSSSKPLKTDSIFVNYYEVLLVAQALPVSGHTQAKGWKGGFCFVLFQHKADTQPS